ncbi:cadherin-like beta sandwich domain-containing protein [Teredinibacter sp. KSP-S5-2]|uniref:cadherin-like beta sandwich domain-containing protein n=1 Tax=Teredinibacter sp. KSP-S5-2 TaxID=3034506 RepID=UPI002934FCC9|nr:cadherin-like beta sandwich domain-containing protein [Teredinibacter sp. KSP-S5-2]WNO10324.1 cadherin-like beta sandwich domain-containing protein [Teredinibacter sp. KSP-S5-2]
MSRTILNTSWMLTLLSFLVLAGCGGSGGGDAETGLTKIPDLTLSNLDVRAGDQSLLDFKQGETGPYELSVDSSVSSISILPTANSSNVKILIATVSTELLNNGKLDTIIIDEIEVQSGEQGLRDVQDGDNTYMVTVVDASNTYRLEYRIKIHKVSSDAGLQNLLIDSNGFYQGSLKVTALSESLNFKTATKQYKLETDFSFCSLKIKPVLSEPRAKIWINGRRAYHKEISLTDLPKYGSSSNQFNVFDLTIQSEDKTQTETYTINVERKPSTTTELANLPTLESLSVENSTLTAPFTCTRRQVGAVVSNTVATTGLTVVPTSSSATITISKYEVDENGAVKLDANDDPVYVFQGETLPANEVYALQLDPGQNRYLIQSVAENSTSDTPNIITYSLLVVRSDNNWLTVENSTQLQQALINASAGDEIFLFDGEYQGATDTSGDSSAYFYSAASGTVDRPIVMRGEVGRNATLIGDGAINTSVLKLTGDYWQVSNISLENGETGLLLDSANHNEIDYLNVVKQTGAALRIRNGSSNNIIQNSEFSSSSQGAVIGSDDSQWTTAPTPGEFLPENTGNKIRLSTFGRNILNEHVVVHEGVDGTVIENNIFDSAIKTGAANGETVIRNLGNNTEVRNNSFYNSTDDVESQQVTNVEPDESWHTETWATNLQVFGNRVDVGGKTSDFINNQSSQQVLTGENTRLDGVSLTNAGAFFSDTLTENSYKLQSVSNPTFCLDLGDIKDSDTGDTYRGAVFNSCSNDTTQVWQFKHDVDGRFLLINTSAEDKMIAPSAANFMAVYRFLISFSKALESENNFYMSQARWLVDLDADSVTLRNNLSSSYVITPTSDIGELTPVVLSVNTNSDTQKFKLIAVP